MRNLLLVILVAASFAACKKTRTCNCTVTRSGVITRTSESAGLSIPAVPPLIPEIPIVAPTNTTTAENYNIVTSEISTFDKVSKKQMHTACPGHKEEMIYDRQVMSATGQFTSTTVDSGTKTTECKIE